MNFFKIRKSECPGEHDVALHMNLHGSPVWDLLSLNIPGDGAWPLGLGRQVPVDTAGSALVLVWKKHLCVAAGGCDLSA